MAIAHLFDHTCVIWRKSETLGTARTTTKSFTLVYANVGLKADRKNTVLAQAGPGIVQVGGRRLFFELGLVIWPRDLVEFITGPDSPVPTQPRAIFEVENVTQPRGHHMEVWVTEYDGVEPELGS